MKLNLWTCEMVRGMDEGNGTGRGISIMGQSLSGTNRAASVWWDEMGPGPKRLWLLA